ncbi:relaxase/mobilization nuclease domain-containing protein [Streptomyces calidiresistens]|uniref:Relaxase/mobilization nuclease domain-containing protein n=1 Tax=Streptomyces calidiresistens TaxID=1485586 RepID=A0A7W3XV03_9ACTN|nr:relaxase/mobilization nuclease domain-containing protein [Streptomyces calidiresistens]MBB0228217.1 relaxase/mobilization nuclease domain-containing protein [Streptomyces calidiresistens]
MVPDISLGGRTYGLLAYLYGPGRREEHTDPHLVAAWRPELAPDPGRDPGATLKQLTDRLDLPVLARPSGRRPQRHVWHCSVRTAPGDRHLTDDEWARVAHRVVAAAGIAPEGDDQGCRWVAVRHADDHIHIAATLVRQDGRSPRRHNDYGRAQAECRKIEQEWGLRRLNAGDGTAARRPTSAERSKAEREGRPEPPREILREAVRQALAGAADEDEFFQRLTRAGLRVHKRLAPSGDALGYKVALPGDRNRDGQPIWFPGSTLAPDLSLPGIRRRLGSGLAPTTNDSPDPIRRGPQPGGARRSAIPPVEQAAAVLRSDNDADAAAQLVGLGEVLDALGQATPGSARTEVRAAARAFERATRSHVRAEHSANRALRSAARGILHAGGALGKGEDAGVTAMLLSTLVLAAVAAARWHSARGHAQQAAAARQAAHSLRRAYRSSAVAPMAAMRAHGRNLPDAVRHRYAATLSSALPEQADRVLGESGWDALAATLSRAEEAGHDIPSLLRKAVEQRELDTAESVSDVLVWRIRRAAALPATEPAPRHQSARATMSAARPGRGNPEVYSRPNPPRR